ncbi:MAG: dihydrofolate reductase [Candidatus Azotimanducaceae bacterium]|jgi:dihydrofolate reductase
MENTQTPRISAIAAIGKNRELGKDNTLLWKLDADFARMKELRKGHTLLMGRKTYESIGRELPSCHSVVLTSDKNYVSPYKTAEHTTIAHSLDDAYEAARNIEVQTENSEKEIFVFGGAQIYADTLEQVDRLYLTKIDAEDASADSYFPEYTEFTKVLEETQCEENGVHFSLLTLER